MYVCTKYNLLSIYSYKYNIELEGKNVSIHL